MTEKQRRFVEAYAKDPNATSAAVAAGYTARSAYSAGSRMLKNAEIQAALQALLEPEREGSIASVEDIRRFWTQTMNNINEKSAPRLRASELLAKSLGLFLADSAVAVGTDSETSSVIIYLPKIDEISDEVDNVVDAAEDQPAGPRLISE